jgi:DNA-directed RNA polymerase specialized sigma24 family protein
MLARNDQPYYCCICGRHDRTTRYHLCLSCDRRYRRPGERLPRWLAYLRENVNRERRPWRQAIHVPLDERYAYYADFTIPHVEEFLDTLRPRQRWIVERLMVGYTLSEIARVLGVKPGSLHRGAIADAYQRWMRFDE